MDSTLLTLLRTKASFPPDRFTVITGDFEAQILLPNPAQLKTIKKLLQKGIPVKCLPNLHAKILLIDDRFVFLGSQNFTGRGRKNKEASTGPLSSLEGTAFLEEILKWRSQAQPVSESLINDLIAILKPHGERFRKMTTEIDRNFEKALEESEEERRKSLEEEKRRTLQANIEKLASQSQLQFEHGPVDMSLKWIPRAGFELDDMVGYLTLVVDDGKRDNLLKWRIKGGDGSFRLSSLNRLNMYPLILADTLRMGICRLAKTRISFVMGYPWSPDIQIGERKFSVSVSFPETDTTNRNIIIEVCHPPYRDDIFQCTLDLLFAGNSISLVNKTYSPPDAASKGYFQSCVKILEEDLFPTSLSLDELLLQIFQGQKGWRYPKRHYNTISLFLSGSTAWPGTHYTLGLIEYMDCPLLVIKRND
jgi:hypothetical protein